MMKSGLPIKTSFLVRGTVWAVTNFVPARVPLETWITAEATCTRDPTREVGAGWTALAIRETGELDAADFVCFVRAGIAAMASAAARGEALGVGTFTPALSTETDANFLAGTGKATESRDGGKALPNFGAVEARGRAGTMSGAGALAAALAAESDSADFSAGANGTTERDAGAIGLASCSGAAENEADGTDGVPIGSRVRGSATPGSAEFTAAGDGACEMTLNVLAGTAVAAIGGRAIAIGADDTTTGIAGGSTAFAARVAGSTITAVGDVVIASGIVMDGPASAGVRG